jgi:hypothetical protein
MPSNFTFVPQSQWNPGDYRYGACFSAASIETLAARFGASLHHFVESGLGPGRCFGLRSAAGWQVAIEQFGTMDLNLIVLFENGRCSLADVRSALAALDIQSSAVKWFAPEAE